MKIRVVYQFQGRDRDWIANPFGNGLYQNLDDYKGEFLKYFPGVIFEIVPEQPEVVEVIEFEISE